jgi:hypothetical protein
MNSCCPLHVTLSRSLAVPHITQPMGLSLSCGSMACTPEARALCRAAAGFYVLARWRLAQPAQQRQPGQHGSHNELKDGSTHMQPGLPSVSESGASEASPKLDSASSGFLRQQAD